MSDQVRPDSTGDGDDLEVGGERKVADSGVEAWGDSRVPDMRLEIWKKTVDVQQHFNDLQWRIRALALTLITFALGAASLALKDDVRIEVWNWEVRLAFLVLAGASVLWLIFGYVDAGYHRLLKGAVDYAGRLEAELRPIMPGEGLGKAISRASSGPRRRWWLLGRNLRGLNSTWRLRVLYTGGFLVLAVPAVLVQVGV